MKRLTFILIAITIGTVLISCSTAAREIGRMSQSEKAGVFTEVVSEGPVPAGYADMVIRSSVKTPVAGYYPIVSKGSARGAEVFPFVVNIDGQAVQWEVNGQKHMLPEYVDGKTSPDPEAGEGIKYLLEKKVRLAAGSYTVFLGLPEESQFTSADISVKSGGSYLLEFKPVYRYKTLPTRIPTFLKGINKFEVVLKEITIQDRGTE
jgi:hypothetical protein